MEKEMEMQIPHASTYLRKPMQFVPPKLYDPLSLFVNPELPHRAGGEMMRRLCGVV